MGRNRSENDVNRASAVLWLGIAALCCGGSPRLILADAATTAATTTAPATCLRPAEGAPSYLPVARVDTVALIPPPPALDSAAQRADLQAVLAAQRTAHAHHTTARAVADVETSCARLASAVEEFHGQPATATPLAFLNRAALQAAALTGLPKRYWHRPRPYLASPRVERLGDVALDAAPPGDPADAAAYRQQRDNSSYPSGHAAFGQACATLLARMVPERRRELFARAVSFGDSRLVVGAHYPSDVAAGRSIGTVATALMFANPCFEEDFSAARGLLRGALGLAEASPAP